jgi:hypothetical protein
VQRDGLNDPMFKNGDFVVPLADFMQRKLRI